MFGYPCPFCNQRLLAAPERSGQRTICPKCMKPIVIPSPEKLEQTDAESSAALQAEPDEVPIDMMPAGLDEDDANTPDNRTPLPEPRPAARIGPPAGTAADPIPLQPAAAVLVRNPDSVPDYAPEFVAPEITPTPAPAATPLPLPMPSFPEPMYPQPAYAAPQPQYGRPPASPFPAPGRITGDHPAAVLPPAGLNGSQTAGLIVFNPTDVEAANIAAQLTTVISMTMKPAPEPPSDLRITTGLWIILTACGAALWLFCMMSDTEPLKYVAAIGAAELLIGYLWVAIAFGNREPRKGFSTLLPPLWVYRAANPPYEPGYRPLRFVVAGALLLSLYVIAPKVQPTLFAWIGISHDEFPMPPARPQSPLVKLAEAEGDGDTLGMKRQLALLAKSESFILFSSEDKPAVIATLNRLVRGARTEIRDDALRALTIWSKADAKPAVHAAITGTNDDERETAYELISSWSDPDTVRLLVSQLEISNRARPALEIIGKTEPGRAAIEDAILPLIVENSVERRTEWIALASEFGGAKVLPILESQLKTLVVARERETLLLCIAKIKSRLK